VADNDDDGLISLDFTVPGAFEAKPAELAAPEIPEPPPEPPAPAAPPPPVRRPLPPALEEAATMYAAGRELDAMRRLEAAIKSGEDLGDAAVRAWGGLFELLQVLNRRPAFDALALTFARRFEKSPPAWGPVVDGPHLASESSGGRAHVSLTGVLNAGIGEVLKQAMKLATTSTVVRMDSLGRQELRHLARLRPVHRIEVTQPRESVQRPRPSFAGRNEIEGRHVVGERDGSREAELSALDLVPEARVGGAQVLRHDEKLLGGGGAELPAEGRRAEDGRDRLAPQTVCGEVRDPDPFRNLEP